MDGGRATLGAVLVAATAMAGCHRSRGAEDAGPIALGPQGTDLEEPTHAPPRDDGQAFRLSIEGPAAPRRTYQLDPDGFTVVLEHGRTVIRALTPDEAGGTHFIALQLVIDGDAAGRYGVEDGQASMSFGFTPNAAAGSVSLTDAYGGRHGTLVVEITRRTDRAVAGTFAGTLVRANGLHGASPQVFRILNGAFRLDAK